jgi:hypothetical protein
MSCSYINLQDFCLFLIEIAAIISLAVQDYVDFGIIAGKKETNERTTTRQEEDERENIDCILLLLLDSILLLLTPYNAQASF